MVRTCKSCGHPLPSDEVAADLGPSEKRLYEAVKQSGRLGIHRDRLMDAVYSHKINGGPLSENALWVTRYDLNKKLTRFGLQIIANRRGPGALWRLEKFG